jgi:hypothetical protein
VGALEARRLESEQEAGASVVERRSPKGAPKAAKTASSRARRERERRHLAQGGSENGCTKRKAEHKNHVWSYDFVMDRTENGRTLKMMLVVDEYTRECLCIEVERSITAVRRW